MAKKYLFPAIHRVIFIKGSQCYCLGEILDEGAAQDEFFKPEEKKKVISKLTLSDKSICFKRKVESILSDFRAK
jgi:hypothetical protein